MVKFTDQAIRAQSATSNPYFVLKHHEDLERRKTGADQASIWKWSAIRELAELDEVKTGALRQSDWETDVGSMAWYRKDSDGRMPTFDEDNRYLGPLNRQKINSEMLIGRNKEVFKLAATAVWPAALCEVLARNLVAELWKTASTSKAQEKGESRGRERRRIVGTSNEEEGNDDDQVQEKSLATGGRCRARSWQR